MSDTEMMLREALERINAMRPVTCEMTLAHDMADIAEAALASSPGGERDAVIEECAKVAEAQNAADWFEVGKVVVATGKRIASAIRALKSQPSDLGEGR